MLEFRDFSFIQKYFTGEKNESLLFLLIGMTALLAAVVFFFFIKTNPSFYKGMAIPLFIIALIQLTVGYTVYARTDKQVADIAYKIGMEPVQYTKSTELPRMQTVKKNFTIYRWIEIALLLAGLVLIFLYRSDVSKTFLVGIGIALAIQAAIMLAADYFAEQRGKTYQQKLEKILSEK